MKKIIATIFFLFVPFMLYAQDGLVHDYSTEALEVIEWDVSDVDSAETAHSSGFGAEEFVSNYLRGVNSAWTGRDTTSDVYIKSNDCYAESYVNGTGSVDSLSLLTLSGLNVNGSWVVFDTLKTNKTSAIKTVITPGLLPYFTQWRVDATGADLTVSGYDMAVKVKLICPKRRD